MLETLKKKKKKKKKKIWNFFHVKEKKKLEKKKLEKNEDIKISLNSKVLTLILPLKMINGWNHLGKKLWQDAKTDEKWVVIFLPFLFQFLSPFLDSSMYIPLNLRLCLWTCRPVPEILQMESTVYENNTSYTKIKRYQNIN